MRKIMLVCAAVGQWSPALALGGAAFPRLDIAQTCRAASTLHFVDHQSATACMTEETQAKAQLAKNWMGYAASARSRCSELTTIGGSPSYVEVLVCLDINKSLSGKSKQEPGNQKSNLRLVRSKQALGDFK